MEHDSRKSVTGEENGWEKDSADEVRGFENEVADDEAETIMRSCGQQTPHLWPNSFPAYSAEVYFNGSSAYSNLDGEDILIADIQANRWTYHTEGKVLAAALSFGAVAICKFITK